MGNSVLSTPKRVVGSTLRRWRRWREKRQFEDQPLQAIFSTIYETNYWGDTESASGPGSNLEETAIIREELRPIIEQFQIGSILDIPCGDFNWMQTINLDGVQYTGADIVADIVNSNKRFETSNISFQQMNLVTDRLPKVDMIFVRDCLVHLSNQDVQQAITRICESESKYLFTTTFYDQSQNADITTGQWRAINLQLPPFNFPKPELLLNESRPNGTYLDKSMGLWKVSAIQNKVNI